MEESQKLFDKIKARVAELIDKDDEKIQKEDGEIIKNIVEDFSQILILDFKKNDPWVIFQQCLSSNEKIQFIINSKYGLLSNNEKLKIFILLMLKEYKLNELILLFNTNQILIEIVNKETFVKNNLENFEKVIGNFNQMGPIIKGNTVSAQEDFAELQNLVKQFDTVENIPQTFKYLVQSEKSDNNENQQKEYASTKATKNEELRQRLNNFCQNLDEKQRSNIGYVKSEDLKNGQYTVIKDILLHIQKFVQSSISSKIHEVSSNQEANYPSNQAEHEKEKEKEQEKEQDKNKKLQSHDQIQMAVTATTLQMKNEQSNPETTITKTQAVIDEIVNQGCQSDNEQPPKKNASQKLNIMEKQTEAGNLDEIQEPKEMKESKENKENKEKIGGIEEIEKKETKISQENKERKESKDKANESQEMIQSKEIFEGKSPLGTKRTLNIPQKSYRDIIENVSLPSMPKLIKQDEGDLNGSSQNFRLEAQSGIKASYFRLTNGGDSSCKSSLIEYIKAEQEQQKIELPEPEIEDLILKLKKEEKDELVQQIFLNQKIKNTDIILEELTPFFQQNELLLDKPTGADDIAAQDNKCCNCKLQIYIGLNYFKVNARKCNYFGKYYCQNCMYTQKVYVPWALKDNFNFQPMEISLQAYQHIEKNSATPFLISYNAQLEANKRFISQDTFLKEILLI